MKTEGRHLREGGRGELSSWCSAFQTYCLQQARYANVSSRQSAFPQVKLHHLTVCFAAAAVCITKLWST